MLFLCCIWAVLLGAAITSLIAAAMPAPSASSAPALSRDTLPTPVILGMTHAARAALGRCGEPGRLRKMNPERLHKLLAGVLEADPKDIPAPALVDTWPQQAAMLAADDYHGLREWQRAWRQTHHLPPPGPEPALPPSPPARRHKATDGRAAAWLIAALVLLLLSLLLYLTLGGRCGHAGVPRCASQAVLATDMLFGYNENAPQSNEGMGKEYGRLYQLFGALHGVELVALEAHTDPIGATEENRQLGRDRVTTVRHMLTRLVVEPGLKTRFRSPVIPPVPRDAGPHSNDAGIWKYCFTRFHLKVADREFAPLRNLRPELNPDNRPQCDDVSSAMPPGGKYPACGSPYEKTIAETDAIYSIRAENFRKLTSCLAPMRYVTIHFNYDAG